jgi:oxygen-independent coproporphyrinogen-3 oxidase
MSFLSTLPLSIYLHIPFCTTRCSYCAFNVVVNAEPLIPAFVEALRREIALMGKVNPYPMVHTLYFGGGTPTLLTPSQFEALLSTLREHFTLADDIEISTEANPNDLSAGYCRDLRGAGINRLSIGMQSANAAQLRMFARQHDAQTVVEAVNAARAGGFDNINLDLIYGSPGQTLDDWKQSLNMALQLEPQHLSMYALGLEDGTPMTEWVASGRLPNPDDDLTADMYDLATDDMAAAGFAQYEISNWARPGLESRHNMQYWRNHPYLGLGPGAHGFAANTRYSVVRPIGQYIRALEPAPDVGRFPLTPACDESYELDQPGEIVDTLIMGLRLLNEGINRHTFRDRFGVDALDVHGDVLRKYADYELLTIDDHAVRLTRRGRLLSNMIFRDLV